MEGGYQVPRLSALILYDRPYFSKWCSLIGAYITLFLFRRLLVIQPVKCDFKRLNIFFVINHNTVLGKEAWITSEEIKWCNMKRFKHFIICRWVDTFLKSVSLTPIKTPVIKGIHAIAFKGSSRCHLLYEPDKGSCIILSQKLHLGYEFACQHLELFKIDI